MLAYVRYDKAKFQCDLTNQYFRASVTPGRTRDEPILMRHRMSLATRENFQEMSTTDCAAGAAFNRHLPNFLASDRILGRGESFGERKSITKRRVIF